jgi:hypothetical protein
MSIVDSILSSFLPISLAEMDSVKLLDRTDTKFIFHSSRLPDIIASIKDHYKVLEIDNIRINDYETLYFDTLNFELYLRHHNEKLNRYKIRFRKYVNSNLHFFEIKHKNNKSRTIKSRVVRPEIELDIKEGAKKLLESKTSFEASTLLPKLWVNYSRITFVHKNFEERLTIDLNLTFKNGDNEKKFETLVIAELKRDKASSKSPFIDIMNACRIRENSISKYCLAVTQLFPDIKQNNFKPKILTLKKLMYALT